MPVRPCIKGALIVTLWTDRWLLQLESKQAVAKSQHRREKSVVGRMTIRNFCLTRPPILIFIRPMRLPIRRWHIWRNTETRPNHFYYGLHGTTLSASCQQVRRREISRKVRSNRLGSTRKATLHASKEDQHPAIGAKLPKRDNSVPAWKTIKTEDRDWWT